MMRKLMIMCLMAMLSASLWADSAGRSTERGNAAPDPMTNIDHRLVGALGQKSGAIGQAVNADHVNDQGFFEREYSLEVFSRFSFVNPSAGIYVFGAGSAAACTSQAACSSEGYRYYCVGVVGTGSVDTLLFPDTTSLRAVNVVLLENSTLTWDWVRQDSLVSLTVSSAHDTPTPNGTTYHRLGEVVNATCNDTMVVEGPDTFRLWAGSLTEPCPGTVHDSLGTRMSITMTANACLTWRWYSNHDTATYLVVTPDCYRTGQYPMPGRYPAPLGTVINATHPARWTVGSHTWFVLGSNVSCATDNFQLGATRSFAIAGPCTLSWACDDSTNTVPLCVTSDCCPDEPGYMPPIGCCPVAIGTPMTLMAPDSCQVGGVTYYVYGWTGTGSVPARGVGHSVAVTMNYPSTIHWLCAPRPSLTDTLVVLPDCYRPRQYPMPGTYPVIHGTSVTAWHTLQWTSGAVNYVLLGSEVSCAVPSYQETGPDSSRVIIPSGTCSLQWVCIPETIRVTLDISATSSCSTCTAYAPTIGHHQYARGATVTLQAPEHCTIGGIGYTVYGWSGTGSVPAVGYGTSVTIGMNANSSILWRCLPDDSLIQVVVDAGACNGCTSTTPAPGIHLYPRGTTVSFTTCPSFDLGGVMVYNVGYTLATGTGTVRENGSSYTHTITVPETLTWLCTPTPETLVVFGCGDTPSPPVGTTLRLPNETVCVRMDSTFRPYPGGCNGGAGVSLGWWQGTGDIPPQGGENEFCFNITQRSSLTWLCGDSCAWVYLDVISSFYADSGNSYPPIGRAWFPVGTSVTAFIDTVVTRGGRTGYCIGFTGSGSVPLTGTDNSVTFTITRNSTLDWQWSGSQACVVIDIPPSVSHDSPMLYCAETHDTTVVSPGTNYCFPVGSHLRAWVTDTSREGIDWCCIGWTGSGDSLSVAPGFHPGETSVEFTIMEACTLNWNWMACSLLSIPVTIVAPCGNPSPPAGTAYYPYGMSLNCRIDSVCSNDDCSRRRVTGWQRVGSDPDTGFGTSTRFTVTAPTTLTWSTLDQYYLTMLYAGTGGYRPTQVGEGWHYPDSLVTVVADTPFHQPGDTVNWTAFRRWVLLDGSVNWEASHDSISSIGHLSLTANCPTLIGYYSPAVRGVVRIDPNSNDCGDISVNGRWYTDVSIVRTHWAIGSWVNLAVTSPDFCSTDSVFTFKYWDADTTERDHDLFQYHPLAFSDTLVRAHFGIGRRIVLSRVPEVPGFNQTLSIGDTSSSAPGNFIVWCTQGERYTIQAFSDSTATQRVHFNNWRYGASNPFSITIESGGYVDTAFYQKNWKVRVVKSPMESYGNININNFWFDGVGDTFAWVQESTICRQAVSQYDYPPDYSVVYTFDRWSSGGPIDHNTPLVTGWRIDTAYYVSTVPVIDIRVVEHDSTWRILNAMPDNSYVTDSIRAFPVGNYGNMPIRYGLQIIYPDALSSWQPAYYNSIDCYMMRAKFEDRSTTPSASAFLRNDYVGRTLRWAEPTVFAPGGTSVLPYDPAQPGRDHGDTLWLLLRTPTFSNFDSTRIRLRIHGQLQLTP